VERGEVWWGAPALPGETRKRRPFLVVSNDAFNQNEAYEKVLVVHLTTVARALGPYSWEVGIRRGVAGIPRSSTAKCGEVYTLWKSDLDERLGALPKSIMLLIDRALTITLGLE
jgi:mRNA-degrading endonuclease toxin of MazEF toxin-antitoxin module